MSGMQTHQPNGQQLDTTDCSGLAACVCERCQAVRADGIQQQKEFDGHRLRAHADMLILRAEDLRRRGLDDRAHLREIQAAGVRAAADELFPV